MIQNILLSIVITLLLAYIFNYMRKPPNYPPGPPWLPFTGNLNELKKLSRKYGGQYLALSEMARRYNTNVLGLKLGGDLTIVVFSYPTVRNVLLNELYEGRPDNFFMRLRGMGTRKGITGTDGKSWSIQRNFVVKHLRTLGFGKKPMEQLIKTEITELLDALSEGQDKQIGAILAPSVINIIWSLTTGTRFTRKDPQLDKLLQLLHLRSKAFDMSGGSLNLFPWLRFVAPERSGFNLICRLNKEFHSLFMKIIQDHYNNWSEGRNDDIIYSFMSEIHENNKYKFTDDDMVMVCLDMFIAGSQTTSNTLDFAFLMMIMYPDIQGKVQVHLDTVFGKDKEIEFADRHKVPYVEAVILEVMRYCLITPFAGPRRVLKNTTLEGYSIPQETTVLISLHSVHYDKNHWQDPDVFRPERFLNEDKQLTSHEWVILFGLGKRRCLGEVLAKNCIFTFFSEVMRRYTIELQPGTKLPTKISVPGITLSPEPYRARFIERY